MPNLPLRFDGRPVAPGWGRFNPSKSPRLQQTQCARLEPPVVTSGNSATRTGHLRRVVFAGDAVADSNDVAVQLTNTCGDVPNCSLVAESPPIDSAHYPVSDKWDFSGQGAFTRSLTVHF